jgi:hypothetical protein
MTGRVTTLGGFVNTHIRAFEGILKVAAIYREDDRLAIGVIDNTAGIAHARVADLRFVEGLARRWPRELLRAELFRATNDAYERGKKGDEDGLSELLYKEFIRRAS